MLDPHGAEFRRLDVIPELVMVGLLVGLFPRGLPPSKLFEARCDDTKALCWSRLCRVLFPLFVLRPLLLAADCSARRRPEPDEPDAESSLDLSLGFQTSALMALLEYRRWSFSVDDLTR